METRIDEARRIFEMLSAQQQEEILELVLLLLQEWEDPAPG